MGNPIPPALSKDPMSPRHARTRTTRPGEPVSQSVPADPIAPARLARTPAILAVLVLVLGTGVFLYPSAASWFSAVKQSQAVQGYAETVGGMTQAERQAELDRARAYNDTLVGGVVHDPFTAAEPSDDPATLAAVEEYLSLLAVDETMVRLRIPAIGVDLPVFHGTSTEALEKGVGHLFGTALPVGGAGTHAVFTGHRGFPESTLFTDLDDVVLGDTFTIDVLGERLTYQVDEISVVLPTDTEKLNVVPGEDHVTLITCTPYAVNSHRLLVRGVRIPTPESEVQAAAESAVTGPGFPWWMVIAGAVTLGGIVIIVRVCRGPRAPREPRTPNPPRQPRQPRKARKSGASPERVTAWDPQ